MSAESTNPTPQYAELCERLQGTSAWIDHLPLDETQDHINACEEAATALQSLHAENERLRGILGNAIPRNVCLTNRNIPDSYVVPIDVTMGELRGMAAALSPDNDGGGNG